jgi:hypothetical protein
MPAIFDLRRKLCRPRSAAIRGRGRGLRLVDWKSSRRRSLAHHRALIQIDSSSPPRNETKVDEYLKRVFEAEGIPVKMFALQPDRANLVRPAEGESERSVRCCSWRTPMWWVCSVRNGRSIRSARAEGRLHLGPRVAATTRTSSPPI